MSEPFPPRSDYRARIKAMMDWCKGTGSAPAYSKLDLIVDLGLEVERQASEIDRLRKLLGETIEFVDDGIAECAHCNYGRGSTGLGSEGEPCEDCSPVRALRKRLAEAAAGRR